MNTQQLFLFTLQLLLPRPEIRLGNVQVNTCAQPRARNTVISRISVSSPRHLTVLNTDHWSLPSSAAGEPGAGLTVAQSWSIWEHTPWLKEVQRHGHAAKTESEQSHILPCQQSNRDKHKLPALVDAATEYTLLIWGSVHIAGGAVVQAITWEKWDDPLLWVFLSSLDWELVKYLHLMKEEVSLTMRVWMQ